MTEEDPEVIQNSGHTITRTLTIQGGVGGKIDLVTRKRSTPVDLDEFSANAGPAFDQSIPVNVRPAP
jgi:hypothetical protein